MIFFIIEQNLHRKEESTVKYDIAVLITLLNVSKNTKNNFPADKWQDFSLLVIINATSFRDRNDHLYHSDL